MKKESKKLTLFEGRHIRRIWDEKKEAWYFSIVDVVRILTESTDARKYWNKLAERLRTEGSESVTKCHRLKMKASDGKYYLTDVSLFLTYFPLQEPNFVL